MILIIEYSGRFLYPEKQTVVMPTIDGNYIQWPAVDGSPKNIRGTFLVVSGPNALGKHGNYLPKMYLVVQLRVRVQTVTDQSPGV